jgi:hypothetical protein
MQICSKAGFLFVTNAAEMEPQQQHPTPICRCHHSDCSGGLSRVVVCRERESRPPPPPPPMPQQGSRDNVKCIVDCFGRETTF